MAKRYADGGSFYRGGWTLGERKSPPQDVTKEGIRRGRIRRRIEDLEERFEIEAGIREVWDE